MYDGWTLNRYFKNPVLTSLTHTWLSHLKIYRKSDFILESDIRLDGIQDWYWNLANSVRGNSIFIDLPLYNHTLHYNQNTNIEKFQKSISKIQMQRFFISNNRTTQNRIFKELPTDQSRILLDELKETRVSLISLVKNNSLEFYVYSPAILVHFAKNMDSDISSIIVFPVSTLEFSEIYFMIDLQSMPSFGLALSSEIPGSLQNLKNLGGLVDFIIALDLTAELFSSMSGIPTHHLEIEGTFFHKMIIESRVKAGFKVFCNRVIRSKHSLLDKYLPRDTNRRRLAAYLYRRYLS